MCSYYLVRCSKILKNMQLDIFHIFISEDINHVTIFRHCISLTMSLITRVDKKKITRWLEDMNFIFSWQKQFLTHLLHALVKYCFHHSKIKFISSRRSVISSIVRDDAQG